MNETKNPFDIVLDAFRQVVREEVSKAIGAQKNSGNADRREWLRAEELAELYDMPRTWFLERGREGVIARTKPGKYVLFYRPDVDRYLLEHKTGGAK
jgi:hypothetical protein